MYSLLLHSLGKLWLHLEEALMAEFYIVWTQQTLICNLVSFLNFIYVDCYLVIKSDMLLYGYCMITLSLEWSTLMTLKELVWFTCIMLNGYVNACA
jgi:hypothetical protein